MFIALGSLILGHAAEAQGKYVRILLTNGKTIEFTLNQKPVIKYGTATVKNKQLPIINFYEMNLIDEQRVAKPKALAAFGVTTNIKSLLKTEKNEINKVYAEYYLETLEAINKTIKL